MFKRITMLALFLVACGGHHAITTPIPESPNRALDLFLTAVKAKDIKGMSQVWGDERDLEVNLVKPDEFRLRVIPLQIYLSHKAYRLVEGPVPVPGMQSRRTYRVELQRATCAFTVTLTVVQMHRGGWLVYGADLTDVSNAAKGCRPDPNDAVKP